MIDTIATALNDMVTDMIGLDAETLNEYPEADFCGLLNGMTTALVHGPDGHDYYVKMSVVAKRVKGA